MEQRTGAELTGLLVSVCTESSLHVGWAVGKVGPCFDEAFFIA